MLLMKGKINKWLCVGMLLVSLAFQTCYVSAMTVPSLYADLNNGTQVSNLVNYATKYDTFYNCKYVCFRDSANSYYLVWGKDENTSVTNRTITLTDCEYVRYYRESNSSDWLYSYSEDSKVSVGCDKLVTTNISGVDGFLSLTVDEWQWRASIRRMILVIGVLTIFTSFVFAVRRE